MVERPFIYRFTKDLRLDDHAGLAAAAARGPVLPLLVLDRKAETRLKSSPRRAAFFCAAVAALDSELRERGSKLVVRRGKPESTIASIAGTVDAVGVAWSASYDSDAMHERSSTSIRTRESCVGGGDRSRRSGNPAGRERSSPQHRRPRLSRVRALLRYLVEPSDYITRASAASAFRCFGRRE